MSCLTEHFERVVVISLAARADRRERLSRHLEQLSLSGGIQWIEAVPGDLSPVPSGWTAGPGAWGCLQSHLAVLRQAANDGVESILILEDDVVFSPHTARCLPLLMEALPDDWGQFYLGGQYLTSPSRTGNPLIWRAGNINRTHAWACHRRHLKDIIAHLGHLEDYTAPGVCPGWHVDHQLGRGHEMALWPAYSSSWWLAGQEADKSDISYKSLQRRWWHPRRYALSLPFVCLTGQSVPEEDARFVSGLEDEEFEKILSQDVQLMSWLHSMAEFALDHGCLPSWRSPLLSIDRVKAFWPAGVRENVDSCLHDYPFNGLFSHCLVAALAASA